MSIKKAAAAVMAALVLGGLCSCAETGDEKIKYEYGVFLGAQKKDAEKLELLIPKSAAGSQKTQ